VALSGGTSEAVGVATSGGVSVGTPVGVSDAVGEGSAVLVAVAGGPPSNAASAAKSAAFTSPSLFASAVAQAEGSKIAASSAVRSAVFASPSQFASPRTDSPALAGFHAAKARQHAIDRRKATGAADRRRLRHLGRRGRM
jgi:hypothetical protein